MQDQETKFDKAMFLKAILPLDFDLYLDLTSILLEWKRRIERNEPIDFEPLQENLREFQRRQQSNRS